MPIILPSGKTLRGAQSAAELDMRNYVRLAWRWGHRYKRFLGLEEAQGVAMEAIAQAAARWVPTRGPFQTLAVLMIRSQLNAAVDHQLKMDGIRLADRPAGKYLRPGNKAVQTQSYQVVPQFGLNDHGEMVDLLESIADPALNPEEKMLAVERDRRRVHAVRSAAGRSSSRVRQILAKGGSIAAMRHGLSKLPPADIRKLKRALGHVRRA